MPHDPPGGAQIGRLLHRPVTSGVTQPRFPGQQQRIGPQPHGHDHRRGHEGHDADDERPGAGRQVQPVGNGSSGAGEVGPEDRPDGGRPDDGAEVAPAPGRDREVGGGIPGLLVGRGDRAEEHGPHKQHGERAHGARDDAQGGPQGADEVAEAQPRAPAVAGHVAREDGGADGGAEHLPGLRQPRHGLRARDVLGQQRGDGDGRAEPDAPDRLGHHEGAHRVPLDALELGGSGGGGGGHRRPSLGRQGDTPSRPGSRPEVSPCCAAPPRCR